MASDPGSPAAPVPGLPGRALAAIYSAIIDRRNAAFDRGRGVVRLDRTVISVGNLSVGGTGKTPMVAHLVRSILAMGRHPCIAMRGYAAPAGGRSDEELEYAALFPGLPIVARPDRAAGIIELLADRPDVDCIILDDGFQHRRLARDLDIVLLDASRDPFVDRLLPAGRLREGVASLRRAHIAITTHAECVGAAGVDAMLGRALDINPDLTVASCRHAWEGIDVHSVGGERAEPTGWLRGRRLGLVCALGNPGPFIAAAREAMATEPAFKFELPDHDPYGPATVERIRRAAAGAEGILTTGKDWPKLAMHAWPVPIARPRLELRFDGGLSGMELMVEDALARGVHD